jgi:hypothetical protein
LIRKNTMTKKKVVAQTEVLPEGSMNLDIAVVPAVERTPEQIAMEHALWLTTPAGKDYLIDQAYIAEVKKTIQIGQRVWKKAHAPETGAIINLCNRITKVNESSVDTEFLYAVVGPEKTMVEKVKDSDEFTWTVGTKCDFHMLDLKQHTAKTTGNYWWECVYQ